MADSKFGETVVTPGEEIDMGSDSMRSKDIEKGTSSDNSQQPELVDPKKSKPPEEQSPQT